MDPVVAYSIEIPNKDIPVAKPADNINLIPASLEIRFDTSKAARAATGKVDNSKPK